MACLRSVALAFIASYSALASSARSLACSISASIDSIASSSTAFASCRASAGVGLALASPLRAVAAYPQLLRVLVVGALEGLGRLAELLSELAERVRFGEPRG